MGVRDGRTVSGVRSRVEMVGGTALRAKKPIGLFWLMVVVGIFCVGCGSPDEQGGTSSGSSQAGSGEAVEVGGAEAIVWGEGE